MEAMTSRRSLDRDIEVNPRRWRAWCEGDEGERLPGDWRGKSPLLQLCLVRAMRPDRLTRAVQWVPRSIVTTAVDCIIYPSKNFKLFSLLIQSMTQIKTYFYPVLI